jgi:hypothetical protein
MDKEALEALLSTLDNWAAFFILLVVLGVGGELIVHLMQSRANKKLVALQHAETRAQETEIASLNKDAEGFKLDVAKANERASEANRIAEQEKLARLKIEERLAPRSLNKTQSDKITAVLLSFAGQKIEIIEYGLSREASSLSKQIQSAIVAAKWDAKVVGVLSGVEPDPGILVLIAKEQAESPAATALVRILNDQGLAARLTHDAGFTPEPYAPGVIRLFVGPKP